MDLKAAVTGLPDIALLQIASQNSSVGTVAQELPCRVPRVGTGPIGPVSDDGNQVRGLVPDGTADTLTGATVHDQTAVDRIPSGPRQ